MVDFSANCKKASEAKPPIKLVLLSPKAGKHATFAVFGHPADTRIKKIKNFAVTFVTPPGN